MKRLIWTRGNHNWELDCSLLKNFPMDILHLPCITLSKVPISKNSNLSATSYIFTSPNGVKYGFEDPKLRKFILKAKKVYTFGDTSYNLLLDHGITPERPSGVNTSKELTDYLLCQLKREEPIISIGAQKVAYDISNELQDKGYNAQHLSVYKTTSYLEASPTEVEIYKKYLKGIICFASPSAIDGFCNRFTPQENRLGKELQAIAIGKTTLESCQPFFQKTALADKPTLISLIEKAKNLSTEN